jgi:hypothetical protein
MPYAFSVGLDLGQQQDYTAVCIAERIEQQPKPSYHLRYLRRWPLKTSYPAIVADVKALLARAPLAGAVQLAIDATGVGTAVYDLFVQARLGCPLHGISITGGDTMSKEGSRWKVPKRDLIGLTQVLLQSERLKIARNLPEAATLTKELLDYHVKISAATMHDSYNAREGAHDDLVLATALALWAGEKFGGKIVLPFRL